MNIVWSRQGCAYCDMAKNLLDQKGVEYEVKMIGEVYTTNDLLESVPSARSVPQIILNDTLIGGFKELKEHFNL